MTTNLQLALQITLVGMGLVFAAIILLWGLMALLVRLAPEQPRQELPEAEENHQADLELKRRAAAIAVAVALAQQNEIGELHEFPIPPTALVSAWQAVMRTSMLGKRGLTRRGYSR
jgi:Na+-transporting methylmalonyl-CoA/oxaloacetate decarboxylase gamma subunit